MEIFKVPFGDAFKYVLQNSAGLEVHVLPYGGIIQSILLPTPDGAARDVVLGYDDMAGYRAGTCYFGAFVGRYANRIKGAEFDLCGKNFKLPPNDGKNHLHGTFCTTEFDAHAIDGGLVLTHTFPDGEEGYPGALEVQARYTLSEDNRLTLDYTARADADTVINLTNHSYFNLNGQDGSDILSHRLTLFADSFTECDSETIPTGKILPVDGTPMDFRRAKPIGQDIFADFPQLTMCRGYDHNMIISGVPGDLRLGAIAENDNFILECRTTQPSLQLYTGNFVDDDGAPHGKNGLRYPRYGGFCLETQHYPCSPNFPAFPSTVLRPGETYREVTEYKFIIK
jgi:aldose 1-epimerase